MEDFDILPSPTLANLFAPQDFDQVVPEMIPTPIIISDDDTESTDDVLEIPSVAPPSPIIIWSTGTTGETPSYDPAEDHGPSSPTPEVGMPSGSPPLEAFELPISPMSPGLPDPTYIPMTDEQAFQLSTCGGSYDDIGEPSSFPYMETATTELPLPLTTYETGGPSSFPAYAPGGSTYFGDPYATQSFYYGQGSEMFTVAEDGYVDPHGYPYHTTTYLGGSDLYPRCFVCGTMGLLTAVCPRYVELLEIPYLPCARPAGGSTEWGHCPNCAKLLYIWRP
ncbi:hypothetical protein HID58_066945 [Brassica napus]|uniref:LITAF domain-containing protein n=1 Tax=Brassica napus TaxID=3708 RepID=A0ABQ7ZH77_BRANA|nr:hypothetical protein HID58_066945 [Brassica napus]